MIKTKKKAMLAAFDPASGKIRHKILRVFENSRGEEMVRLNGAYQPVSYLCSVAGQICTVYY